MTVWIFLPAAYSSFFMKTIELLFGHGKDLEIYQMCVRAISIFLLTLLMIRIAGRRAFGMRSALDNIIVILLGAVLSRAVVGASPFIHVIAASFVLVILYRIFAWLILKSSTLRRIIQGDKHLLYSRGKFLQDNMDKALICKAEIMQSVREVIQEGGLDHIDSIYMERNGTVSIVKKPTSA